jgi:hypothetical protein
MTHECNDICVRKRLLDPARFLPRLKKQHYVDGWRWCNICYIGILPSHPLLHCYCCGAKFRVKVKTKRENYVRLHPTKKLSYSISLRRCNQCYSPNTYVHKKGYRYWYKNKDGHMCYSCYNDIKKAKLREHNKLRKVNI